MAIQRITKIQNPNKGQETASQWEFTQRYALETDGAEYSPYTLLSDADAAGAIPDALPLVGDAHPDEGVAEVRNRSPQQKSYALWHVDIAYGHDNQQPNPDNYDDPANTPARVDDIQYEAKETPQDFAYQSGDLRGDPTKPVQNSRGRPFREPLMTTQWTRVFFFTIFESTWTDSNYKDHINTINDAAVTYLDFPFGAGEALCRNIKPLPRRDRNGNTYWKIIFVIVEDQDMHLVYRQDIGFEYKDSSGNVQEVDADKREEVNLDGSGVVVTDGSGPAKLAFQPYYPKSWSLPLPSTFS